MALAAGEDEKIMQGLHENYLESKVKDPHMDCVSIKTCTHIMFQFRMYFLLHPNL